MNSISTDSISNSVSKNNLTEEMSITAASLEEAARRIKNSGETETISNERIGQGDIILDTYVVTSDVINGGMGSVWRVRHESWGKNLAMKRPQPRFFQEAGNRRKEEFIKECENWIDLGLHPEIVSCYYVRDTGGVPAIFSEWMTGGSLRDRISDKSLYSGTDEEVEERIFDIAVQAARGLLYAHGRGLVHQDMKPGNLLLTRRWKAKIADFGLAKAASAITDGSEALSTGYTLAYCPAEQINGGPAEPWMDMYAWALTVLEMYGQQRFWETGPDAADHAAEYFDRCPVRVPEKIRGLLLECLSAGKTGTHPVTDKKLTSVYEEVFGHPYPHPLYPAGADSVEALNNKALSYLDLGKPELAEEYWERALKTDNRHVDSIVNRGIYEWRLGRKNDVQLRDRLSEIEDEFTRREVLSEFYTERGSEQFSLKYPSPVTGELPGTERMIIKSARIDGSILSFVMEETEKRAFVILRYDLETGKLLETIPDAGVSLKMKSDRINYPVLAQNADRMLTYHKNTFLWDTRRQKTLAEFNDMAYIFDHSYISADNHRVRHLQTCSHYPENSSCFVASNRPPEGLVYTTIQNYSDGSRAAYLGNKGDVFCMDDGCAVLVSNASGGLKKQFYDFAAGKYLSWLPDKEYDSYKHFGAFRNAEGKSVFWEGRPGLKLDFYKQEDRELHLAAIDTPWTANRQDPDHDVFVFLGQIPRSAAIGQYLYAYEMSTGRIISTTAVLPPPEFEVMKDPYPYMLTDYENRRVILYFLGNDGDVPVRPEWYVVPLPKTGMDGNAMTYRVSFPASARAVSDAGRLLDEAGALLSVPEEEADIPGLLSVYNQLRGIPMMEGPQVRRTLEAVNARLLRHLKPAGIRSIQEMEREEPGVDFEYSWKRSLLKRKIYSKAIVHTDAGSALFYLVFIDSDKNERKVMLESYGKDEQLLSVKEFKTPLVLGRPQRIEAADRNARYVLVSFSRSSFNFETPAFMLLDTLNGKMAAVKNLHRYDGKRFVSPDGKSVWIHERNKITVCYADSRPAETVTTEEMSFSETAQFKHMQFSADGSKVLLVVEEHNGQFPREYRFTLILWDVMTGERRAFLSSDGELFHTSMTPDAGFVLLRMSFPERCKDLRTFMLFRTDDGNCLWKGSENLITRYPGRFSSDGVFLISDRDNRPSLSVYWEFET